MDSKAPLQLTGNKKQLQLNDLRSTYITALVKRFGDNAKIISNHSNMEVIYDHYLNNKVIIEAATDFDVFD